MKLARFLPAALILSIALNTADATELNTGEVASDALWLVHMDFAALRDSEFGIHMMDKMTSDKANQKIEDFMAIFKFDPRHDLDSVTLYGSSAEKKEGVALLKGRFDTAHLVSLIKENEQYSSDVHVTRTLHTWADEHKGGKLTHGCVVHDNLIVIGDDEALVKHAVDVLDGRAENMSASPSLGGLSDATEATMFMASANMKQMHSMHPRAAILKQNEAVSCAFMEKDGRMQGVLRMVSKDNETATAMHSIAQGLISLSMLNQNLDAGVMEMAKSLKLGVDGNEVSVRMDYPTVDLIEVLKACKQGKCGR